MLKTVEDLAHFGQRAILVVDDCPEEVHGKLERLVASEPSALSLVTLTDDFRERQATRPEWLVVPPAPDTTIEALLEAVAPEIERDDRRRLVDLALGYPGAALDMAKLWGDERFVSGLGHDEVVDRVVLGRRPTAGKAPELMEAAELISVVGTLLVERPPESGRLAATEETDHITELAGLSRLEPDALRAAIADLAERGACRRYGRAARLEPRPIAWHLAQSCWQAWSPDRWDEIVCADALSPRLRSQALDVLADLNTTDIGHRVARHVCRAGGPLDHPDVLGDPASTSALARLSEIDSEIVLRLVESALDGLDREDIAALPHESRRHLVAMLSRAAAEPATFERAVERLLDVAEAHERAHGTPDSAVESALRVLFWPAWSSTRASSAEVLRCVDAELERSDAVRQRLVTRALAGGVTTKDFARVVSTDHAGTRALRIAEDRRTWGEVFDHVRACGDRLAQLATGGDAVGVEARAVLGERIGGLLRVGLVDDAERWVREVTEAGRSWPEAAPRIGQFMISGGRGGKAPEAGTVARAKTMLDRLTPSTLEDRLRAYVAEMDWTYPYGESLTHKERNARVESLWGELADELLANEEKREALLRRLCRGKSPREAARFGRVLAGRPCASDHPLDLVEAAWLAVDVSERVDGLLLGTLGAVADADPERFRSWKARAFRDSRLAPLLPSALRWGAVTDADVSGLLDAVSAGWVPESHAAVLAHSNVDLDQLDTEGVRRLVCELAGKGRRWEEAAVNILSGYLEDMPSRGVEFFDVLESLVESTSLAADPAQTLAQTILEVTRAPESDAHRADALLSRIGYRAVTETNAHAFELAQAVLEFGDESEVGMVVKGVLEAAAKHPERRNWVSGVLNDRNEQPSPVWCVERSALFDWADAHLDCAPAILASLTSTGTGFAGTEKVGLDEHVAELLVRYGDRRDVREALCDALHWRSWIGDTSSYWQTLLEPLTALTTHENRHVRSWAWMALDMAKRWMDRDLINEATSAMR